MFKMKIALAFLAMGAMTTTAQAKSGMSMIKTTKLQYKVCGTQAKDCLDSVVYRGTEYDLKHDAIDPVKSEALDLDLKKSAEEFRSKRTKYIGPMTALIAISKSKNEETGRKTLYILDETFIDYILR